MFDIITIGSVARDVFLDCIGMVTLRSKQFTTGSAECIPLGSKLDVEHIHFTVGGSAANSGVTFARRKLRTAVVSKIGDDIRAQEIIRTLAAEGIETKFLSKDKKALSPYSIILLTEGGERSILAYRGAGKTFSPKDVTLKNLSAKWFYITHLSGKAAALFPKILRYAEKNNIRVAVNPGKTQLNMPQKQIRPLLNLIDVVLVNREEASILTGVPYEKESLVFERLDDWVRGIVVMTDGPGGVTISDGDTRFHAGILQEKRCVDRTGAGDSFGSGFVAGLIEKGWEYVPGTAEHKRAIRHAMQLGSANATSVIEHIGGQEGILKKGESITKWGKLDITETTLH